MNLQKIGIFCWWDRVYIRQRDLPCRRRARLYFLASLGAGLDVWFKFWSRSGVPHWQSWLMKFLSTTPHFPSPSAVWHQHTVQTWKPPAEDGSPTSLGPWMTSGSRASSLNPLLNHFKSVVCSTVQTFKPKCASGTHKMRKLYRPQDRHTLQYPIRICWSRLTNKEDCPKQKKPNYSKNFPRHSGQQDFTTPVQQEFKVRVRH